MPNRSICKFFVQGACLKGNYCEFSHDWNDQTNNVCTYYQKGVCCYGSRCRYEHAEVSHDRPPPSSTAVPVVSSSSWILNCPLCIDLPTDVSNQTQQIFNSASSCSGHQAAQRYDFHEDYNQDDGNNLSLRLAGENQAPLPHAHLPICSSAATGTCPYGKECPQMHGDLCTTCGKHCLHPYRPSEREMHIKMCTRNNKRFETLKKGEEIECSVCLDRVLSKSTAEERRFGILPECDHSFCITCIRKWRSSFLTSAVDIGSTVKACPICRTVSYYVISSTTWYSSKEEKQEIIDGYRAKLKSIDCKYFDFGNDTCPFGSRCFYKHAYSDGSLEVVLPPARLHFHTDDGTRERARARNIESISILGQQVTSLGSIYLKYKTGVVQNEVLLETINHLLFSCCIGGCCQFNNAQKLLLGNPQQVTRRGSVNQRTTR